MASPLGNACARQHSRGCAFSRCRTQRAGRRGGDFGCGAIGQTRDLDYVGITSIANRTRQALVTTVAMATRVAHELRVAARGSPLSGVASALQPRVTDDVPRSR